MEPSEPGQGQPALAQRAVELGAGGNAQQRLCELQAPNAERAAAAGRDYASLLAEIRQAYKGGDQGR